MTPKKYTVTFLLPEETNPATPTHLHQILKNDMKSRGYKLEDDATVILYKI